MNQVISIIEKSQLMYLATINSEGFPEIRGLLNLINPKKYSNLVGKAMEQDGEQLTMYFSTNTSSRKVEQIRYNNKVSLYFCEPEQFHGVCAVGTMEEVTDDSLKDSLWQEGWEIYYPNGKSDPDYTILKFTSKSIHSWYDFGIHNFGDQLP